MANISRSVFSWKITLIVAQQIMMLLLISKLNNDEVDEFDGGSSPYLPSRNDERSTSNEPSAIRKANERDGVVLAGISHSDDAVSDFAVRFLVDAACDHGMESHILLRERDEASSLTRKIAALAHHRTVQRAIGDARPPRGGAIPPPECAGQIYISEEALSNRTAHHVRESSGGNADRMAINNPLDPESRIARIKRSRERQREALRETLGTSADERGTNLAIGVLDLDLFAYPSPSELLAAAREHVLPLPEAAADVRNSWRTPGDELPRRRYHALCANGAFVRVKDGNYRDVRYYDTYSTILLPDGWLYREPGSSRRKKRRRRGSAEEWRPMNQSQAFRHFLRRGTRHGASTGTAGTRGNGNAYEPVPVRSCFGGLALYRADVWLDPECRYDSYHEDDAAFASEQYRHACEHVVFHECLRRKMGESSEGGRGGGAWDKNGGVGSNGFAIAVKPDMTTLWHTT